MRRVFIYIISSLMIINLFPILPPFLKNIEAADGTKTVIDYYLQLPDSYYQCESENILQKKDKLSMIISQDLKKGYIKATTLDGGIPIEAALYTDETMGISVLAVNVKCPSGCMCRKLDFFFASEGRLLKIDGDFIFPKIEEIEKAAGKTGGYNFTLSEYENLIYVVEEQSGKVLLKIRWRGGTFIITL